MNNTVVYMNKDRHLNTSLADICRTVHIRVSMAHGPFCGKQAQDRSQHTPGVFKNALRPVGIPLKKGCLRRQAIKLAFPERLKERWSQLV